MKPFITSKVVTLPDRGLVELVAYALGLLVYRGRATIQDFQEYRILLSELPQEQARQKVA